MKSWPSPTDLFRISALLCLLGAMVLTAAAVRTWDLEAAEHDKNLALLLLTCLLPFALFYVGHLVVQRRIGRELDLQLGYVQVLGSLAIVAAAAMTIFLPALAATFQPLSGWLQNYAWFFTLVFGEGVFVANAARASRAATLQKPGLTAARAASMSSSASRPFAAGARTRTWGWPRSATETFAIAALVLALLGWLFSSANPGAALPASSDGRFLWIPASHLWLLAALPFAIFVAPYGVLEWKGWKFADSTTRIHFICTLLVVLDLVRLYKDWVMSMASRFEPRVTGGDFLSTTAFLALALGTFAWNIRNAARLPSRSPSRNFA